MSIEKSYELSPEMEIATAGLYYGVIESYDFNDPADERPVKDRTGQTMCDEFGDPYAVCELILDEMYVNQEIPAEVTEPYVQTLYYSADCVMNEMIREFAKCAGSRFINVETIPYWRKVIFGLGFMDLYSSYFSAINEERPADFEDIIDCANLDILRPRLRLEESVAPSGITVNDLLDGTNIYQAFQEVTGHVIELYTTSNNDLTESRKVLGSTPNKNKQVICRVCADSYFVNDMKSDLFVICPKCTKA